MVTIHDVAKLAGVSIATVSNVINNNDKVSAETAERVNQAIRALNYVPNIMAKALKTKAVTIIGVLAEDVSNFASPGIIDGICQECEKYGYHVVVDNLRVNTKVDHNVADTFGKLAKSKEFKESVNDSVSAMLRAGICGLIHIGVHTRDVSDLLPVLNVPVVYTYCYAKHPASERSLSINYDGHQGARLAAEDIISAGHTKIAILSGVIDDYPAYRRMMGYQTALMEHNIPLHPEYIMSGNWTYESGYTMADKLFSKNDPPSAVLAMNDLMAFGIIDRLKERGLSVPGDVSVHGFDDIETSRYFSPPLSTISLPLREMGQKAALNVMRLAHVGHPSVQDDNDNPDKPILIPCVHVKRASV